MTTRNHTHRICMHACHFTRSMWSTGSKRLCMTDSTVTSLVHLTELVVELQLIYYASFFKRWLPRKPSRIFVSSFWFPMKSKSEEEWAFRRNNKDGAITFFFNIIKRDFFSTFRIVFKTRHRGGGIWKRHKIHFPTSTGELVLPGFKSAISGTQD